MISIVYFNYGGSDRYVNADQIERYKDYTLSAETIDRYKSVYNSGHHGKLIVTEIIHDDNGTIDRAAESTFGEYAL